MNGVRGASVTVDWGRAGGGGRTDGWGTSMTRGRAWRSAQLVTATQVTFISQARSPALDPST
jgi:hypothetical protein